MVIMEDDFSSIKYMAAVGLMPAGVLCWIIKLANHVLGSKVESQGLCIALLVHMRIPTVSYVWFVYNLIWKVQL